MAQNKMGTTIGGHLAWHSGNLEAFFKAAKTATRTMGKMKFVTNASIMGTNVANAAAFFTNTAGTEGVAIDENEIVGTSDLYIGSAVASRKLIFRLGTSSKVEIQSTLFKSNVDFRAPKAIFGGTQSPSITCAFGDADTGFKWISDGKFQTYTNNVAIDEVTSAGRKLLKHLDANLQHISNVNILTATELKNADGKLRIQGGGIIQRYAHAAGYMVGSYNSVGPNSTKTNPIYTIGSAYKPNDTSLGNMHGIGYANATDAPYLSTVKALGAASWGLYVCKAGNAKAFISGDGGIWGQGNLRMNGQVRGNGGLYWGSQSTDARYIRKAIASQTIDGGDNTSLTLKSNDNGESLLSLYGDDQGSGRLYVGQSSTYGGGIEYNGDGTPTGAGAGADYTALFRRHSNTNYWTARNHESSNNWEFRGDVKAATFQTTNGYAHFRRNTASAVFYVTQQGGGNIAEFRAGSGDGTVKSYIYKDGGYVSNATTGLIVNSINPTVRLQDSNGKTAFLHQNNNVFHILRSAGDNGTSWDGGPNNRYPMKLDLNTGDCVFSGNVQGYSDARLKTKMVRIPKALDKISKLRGITYYWKDATDQPRRQTGLIAQEVEKVLPEVVVEDEKGFKTIAYANTVGLLVEGIKEERAKREVLEKRLAKLEQLLLKGE